MIINYALTCGRYLPERLFFAHLPPTRVRRVLNESVIVWRATLNLSTTRKIVTARGFFFFCFFVKFLSFCFSRLGEQRRRHLSDRLGQSRGERVLREHIRPVQTGYVHISTDGRMHENRFAPLTPVNGRTFPLDVLQ